MQPVHIYFAVCKMYQQTYFAQGWLQKKVFEILVKHEYIKSSCIRLLQWGGGNEMNGKLWITIPNDNN